MAGYKIKFSKDFKFVVLSLCMYFAYIILSLSWADKFDLSLLNNATGIFLHLIPGCIGVYLLHRYVNRFRYYEVKYFDEVSIFLYIQISIFVISIFTSISLISPDIRVLLEQISVQAGNVTPDHPQYDYRVRGILNSAGAGASLFFAIGLIISFYLFLGFKKINLTYFAVSALSITLAILSTGRTGLIALVMVVFVHSSLRMIYSASKILSKLRIYASDLIIILSFSGFLFLFVVVLFVFRFDNEWLAWLVRDFYYMITLQFDKGTIGKLLESHLVVPQNSTIVSLIMGDQSYYSINRVPTDMGYLRMFYSGGVSSLLYYFSLLFIFYQSYRFSIHSSSKDVVKYLFLVAFIFEIKEPFMIDLRFTTIYFLIYFFVSAKPEIKKVKNYRDFQCS
ncbi:MAG: hypothetical protein LAT80_09910 [Balneolaceae bacterium]|nr:hypothetical protein [Balneolaceae bacterium]